MMKGREDPGYLPKVIFCKQKSVTSYSWAVSEEIWTPILSILGMSLSVSCLHVVDPPQVLPAQHSVLKAVSATGLSESRMVAQ